LKRPNASFFAFRTLQNFHWAICTPFLDRCDKCLTLFWPPWSALKRVPQADPLSASPLRRCLDLTLSSHQLKDRQCCFEPDSAVLDAGSRKVVFTVHQNITALTGWSSGILVSQYLHPPDP
jgi:hypothetical protein